MSLDRQGPVQHEIIARPEVPVAGRADGTFTALESVFGHFHDPQVDERHLER